VDGGILPPGRIVGPEKMFGSSKGFGSRALFPPGGTPGFVGAGVPRRRTKIGKRGVRAIQTATDFADEFNGFPPPLGRLVDNPRRLKLSTPVSVIIILAATALANFHKHLLRL
jgi:hypothetical protein